MYVSSQSRRSRSYPPTHTTHTHLRWTLLYAHGERFFQGLCQEAGGASCRTNRERRLPSTSCLRKQTVATSPKPPPSPRSTFARFQQDPERGDAPFPVVYKGRSGANAPISWKRVSARAPSWAGSGQAPILVWRRHGCAKRQIFLDINQEKSRNVREHPDQRLRGQQGSCKTPPFPRSAYA